LKSKTPVSASDRSSVLAKKKSKTSLLILGCSRVTLKIKWWPTNREKSKHKANGEDPLSVQSIAKGFLKKLNKEFFLNFYPSPNSNLPHKSLLKKKIKIKSHQNLKSQ